MKYKKNKKTPYSDKTKHKDTTLSHEYSSLKILEKNLEEFL